MAHFLKKHQKTKGIRQGGNTKIVIGVIEASLVFANTVLASMTFLFCSGQYFQGSITLRRISSAFSIRII